MIRKGNALRCTCGKRKISPSRTTWNWSAALDFATLRGEFNIEFQTISVELKAST
jgi:hypothetical protein